MTERIPLVVRLLPATKERLRYVPATMSMTRLLEEGTAGWEKRTLARLKSDEHRKFYMQGVLSAEVAFKRRNALKGKAYEPASERTAILSAAVTTECREQLDRFCKFYGIPLHAVIDRVSLRLEKHFKGRPPPEQAPEPEPEPEPDPSASTRELEAAE